MKRIVFVVGLILISFYSADAQKDDCSKYFYKEKKQKQNSVFEQIEQVKSKASRIFTNGRRIIAVYFEKNDSIPYLVFLHHFEGDQDAVVKDRFVLGENIVIALVWDNGANTQLKFENPEQELRSEHGALATSQYANRVAIDVDLMNKLQTSTLVEVQLLNPFGVHNPNKVKTNSVAKGQAKRLQSIANCFSDKIN